MIAEKKLSNRLKRFSNRYYIIPLLVLLAIIVVLLDAHPSGTPGLKELSGGAGTLDGYFGYTVRQAYDLLGTIGPVGRGLYQRYLCLDWLLAVVFMLLHSLVITALLRMSKADGRWQWLNLLPFVRSAFDIVENGLLLALLLNYPARLPFIAWAADVATVSKWVVFYFAVAATLILCTLACHEFFLKRMKKHEGLEGTV